MKPYVVWLDAEYEDAEAAARHLNALTFGNCGINACDPIAVVHMLNRHLRGYGYSDKAIVEAEPAKQYFADANLYGRGPCRSDNVYNAIVFIGEPLGRDEWMAFFRAENLHERILPQDAEEVFSGILNPADAISYSLLNLVTANRPPHPQDDFLLLPINPEINGLDDIFYLLKDTEWDAGNYAERLHSVLNVANVRWLFDRNCLYIGYWIVDEGVDLMALIDHNPERILNLSGDLCWEVAYRWGCSLIERYSAVKGR
ncbi:hypothetical protein [Neisseria sp. CCUG12390]|uniref:hypothetical protein n=1 Tax=Neisseria sp. CCUG12390 TaxID=3392035 RepID=UPI003A0FD5D6